MSTELNLRFPDAQHVIVRLGPNDDGSRPLSFSNPITDIELLEIQWYVETYGAHSLGDPDDTAAAHIKGMLPVWGKKLFEAVFKEREALERLLEFRENEDDSRLLTISTEHPAILVLPWELLHDPAPGGGFLFMETPRISIRRRVAGATGGRGSFKIAAKDSLRLLFVVSRPDDAGFLDPRADSLPVLDAIDEHAPGRVICEFLRPPTLDALIARLEDKTKPPVDIVRFDGHGVFDRDGGLPERAAKRDGDRFPSMRLPSRRRPRRPRPTPQPTPATCSLSSRMVNPISSPRNGSAPISIATKSPSSSSPPASPPPWKTGRRRRGRRREEARDGQRRRAAHHHRHPECAGHVALGAGRHHAHPLW